MGKILEPLGHAPAHLGIRNEGLEDLWQHTQSFLGDHHRRSGVFEPGCVAHLVPTAEPAGNEHSRRPGNGDLRNRPARPGDDDVTCCVEILHLSFESEDGPRYNGLLGNGAHVVLVGGAGEVEYVDGWSAPLLHQGGDRLIDGTGAEAPTEDPDHNRSGRKSIPVHCLMPEFRPGESGQTSSDRVTGQDPLYRRMIQRWPWPASTSPGWPTRPRRSVRGGRAVSPIAGRPTLPAPLRNCPWRGRPLPPDRPFPVGPGEPPGQPPAAAGGCEG